MVLVTSHWSLVREEEPVTRDSEPKASVMPRDQHHRVRVEPTSIELTHQDRMLPIHLNIRKSTEIAITRKDTILFSRGNFRVDVAQATVGNFDCMPYEPKNLMWSYGAELHRYDEKLWVRVVEYEQTVEVIDGDWVSRTEEEQAVYSSGDEGETWTRYAETPPPLDETTLLDRVRTPT